jgi:alkaline phosphatase D
MRVASVVVLALCGGPVWWPCSPWPQAAGADVHHAQGELAGEVTASSVLLQSRLTAIPGPELDAEGDVPGAAGVACFEWALTDDFSDARRTGWLRAVAEHDFIVRTRIEGLAPATTYHYRLVLGADEGSARPGPARRFRTLPAADSAAPLSFTMGSCQNYAFFMHGKNGRGGGASGEDRRLGYPAYAAMLAREPAFFIGTGDIVYYDHPKATAAQTLPELRRKWHEQFRLPRLVEFLGSTAAFWSKDDHDFRFDDADLDGDRRPTGPVGIDVFREQMPLLDAGDRTSPTYRTHRVHRHLQLWFMEGRDHRSPNKSPDGPEKSLWGAEQRAWLERTLEESDATWRVIVSPTPMVGPDRASKRDNHANLGGFRHEADAFFAWLGMAGIDDLLVFCGDRHWQYHSIHPSGVEEFGCGALNDENAIPGVRPGTKGSTDPDGLIRQPFLYAEPSGGFLHVTVDEDDAGPRLRIAFVDDEGTELHTDTRRPAAAAVTSPGEPSDQRRPVESEQHRP